MVTGSEARLLLERDGGFRAPARWSAQPMVGWAAKGISAVGKKMRIWPWEGCRGAGRRGFGEAELPREGLLLRRGHVSAPSTLASGLPVRACG